MSYVQWENKESVGKMLNDPGAIIQVNDMVALAKVDRTFYKLVYTKKTNTINWEKRLTPHFLSLVSKISIFHKMQLTY